MNELGYDKEQVQSITGHRSDAVLAYDVKKKAKVDEMQSVMWDCIGSGKSVEEFARDRGMKKFMKFHKMVYEVTKLKLKKRSCHKKIQ